MLHARLPGGAQACLQRSPATAGKAAAHVLMFITLQIASLNVASGRTDEVRAGAGSVLVRNGYQSAEGGVLMVMQMDGSDRVGPSAVQAEVRTDMTACNRQGEESGWVSRLGGRGDQGSMLCTVWSATCRPWLPSHPPARNGSPAAPPRLLPSAPAAASAAAACAAFLAAPRASCLLCHHWWPR